MSNFCWFIGRGSEPSKVQKWAYILASRAKFKNRLGAPESIAMMSFSPKNQPICPRRLGRRGGGASDFDGRTSSISGTSVCKQHFLSFAILLYQMFVYEYVPLYLRVFDSIFIGLS